MPDGSMTQRKEAQLRGDGWPSRTPVPTGRHYAAKPITYKQTEPTIPLVAAGAWILIGKKGECVTRLHERLIATAHHRQSNDTSLPKVRADRTTLDSMTQQRQNRGRSRPRLHRITEYQRSPSGPARKWPRASLSLSIGPLQPEEHSSAFGLEAATRDYRRDCPRYVDKWR